MPWIEDAACATAPPDTLFVRGAAQGPARELCFTCPVRAACLVEALETRSEFGVWGGMTERERRALTRRHPEVTDWAAWLAENSPDIETPSMRRTRLRATRTAAAG